MANAKHVKMVRKGVWAILEWRGAHPDERLDLSGADLRRADLGGDALVGPDLSGADLRGADLSDADLRGANLRGANLSGAYLLQANLRWANLSEARLSDADLSGANLRDADLSDADLSRANLSEADLTLTVLAGTNLSEAELGYTSLGSVFLSFVDGLGRVRHSWPSSVDVNTLVWSVRGAGGQLTPELTIFFRGVGVPEEFLREVPRIVAGVKYYSCFISYGEHDLDFAKKLTEDLRGRGVSCWLWETDKTVGQRTQGEIEKKLEEYEKMVVLCSIYSLLGDGIRREIDRQLAKDPEKLIPVSLEEGWKHKHYEVECFGRDLKPFLLDRNYADFANKPYHKALEELLKGLRIEKPAD